MGRKRSGERKYLYGVLACLILFLLSGCASLHRSRFSGELQRAGESFARGDFEGSLKINQNIAALCEGKSPGDEALFNMGLIYASQKYPKKDYRKSIYLFQRVAKEYPQSPLVPQAKTWIGVLDVIERSKEVDVEMEQKKKKLMR